MGRSEAARLSSIVAANVRAQTALRGWSQRELGRRLNMTPATMSDRARGRTPWTVDELAQVAEILGVEVEDLLVRPGTATAAAWWRSQADAGAVVAEARPA